MIWQNEEDMFVPTRATENTIKLLTDSKFIMVTGSSGSGKSSIIHHIALKLKREQGYELVPSTPNGPSDLLTFNNHHKKQVFVLDDAFGKGCLNISLIEQWNCKIEKMKESFRIHNEETCFSYSQDLFGDFTRENTSSSSIMKTKILISCQSHLTKEKRLQHILNSLSIRQIDMHSDDNQLIKREKQEILQRYSSCVKIEDLCTDFNYFPLMCRLSYGKTKTDIKNIFSDPPRHILDLIEKIKDTSAYQFCSITLCVLFDKGFDLQWLQYWNKKHRWYVSGQRTNKIMLKESEVKICYVCKEYGVDLELERHRNRLIESFNILLGSLLKTQSSIQFIIHDKVFDIAAKVCGEALVSLFIKYSSSDFISQRFKMCFVNITNHNKYLITIPGVLESDYFNRIISDIVESDIRSFIFNIQIEDPELRKKLIQYVYNVGKISILRKKIQKTHLKSKNRWVLYNKNLNHICHFVPQ